MDLAPDIAGKGIANPIGQIWSCNDARLFREKEASDRIINSIETTLSDKKVEQKIYQAILIL